MDYREIVIVPARGGSKRLPGKNRLEIGGKSMFARIDDVVSAAQLDVPIYLTTDNPDLAADGESLGWNIPFLRPSELATDIANTTDAILHLLDWRLANGAMDPEVIIVLQPTSPFRTASTLTSAVTFLREDQSVNSVVGMQTVDRPLHGVFVIGSDFIAEPAIKNDSRTPFYIANGALFATRTAAFRQERSLYADRILPLVMDQKQSVDIDTLDDLKLAEAIQDVDIQSYPRPLGLPDT